MLVSICITAYEAGGKGAEFIRRNLDHCLEQTYRPLEVIISDHSVDSAVEDEVRSRSHPEIEIRYFRYPEQRGFPCANWNNAILHSKGDLIRILALDDYLSSPTSIQDTVEWMNTHPEHQWVVGNRYDERGSTRVEGKALWPKNILTTNLLSGPSCVMLTRELYKKAPMDNMLRWLFDVDWYYRLYTLAGKPGFLPYTTWVNSIHENQLTHSVQKYEQFEFALLHEKYGMQLPNSP